MGLINYSKKNNNSSSNFGIGKILYREPTKNVLLKKVLPNIKVSRSADKAKFKEYFKEMAGSSIREMTAGIKKRDEFETKDKKKLLGAFMKHYAPETKKSLSKEEIEGNINIFRSGEKAKYIKEKGGLEEGIGAKSRAERLERAKMGILTEDFTKATSAAGHNNKEESGPHLVGAPAQPSPGILTGKNKISFVSTKSSPRTPAGFVGSPGNKPAGGSLKNLPPTLPENKPPAAIPFSK